MMCGDDPELAMLRRKKMAQLVAREKRMQAERERRQKTDVERRNLLRRFLAPDALTYLTGLKEREPGIGKQIEDVILYLIVYRGVRQTISRIDIMYVERQIRGEGPKIRIQRDGEVSDFGSYVREAIKKNENASD